jgi:hypothetical protein
MKPGTHVRVRRHPQFVGVPYWHHGICVDDSEVIEFGGGDLWNKGQTQIRRVSLASFGQGHSVEEVSHPIKWSGIMYSPLLPPEQVVDRAEWLLHNQPPPYQLGYRNCESIAIWCATGDYESFQVKKLMRGKIPLTLATTALIKRKPSIGILVAVAGIVITALTAVPYIHSRTFFDHTRRYPGIGKWVPSDSSQR